MVILGIFTRINCSRGSGETWTSPRLGGGCGSAAQVAKASEVQESVMGEMLVRDKGPQNKSGAKNADDGGGGKYNLRGAG